MTTEQKIREAFSERIGALYQDWNMIEHDQYLDFKAGYLALLNVLEVVPNGDPDEVYQPCTLYRLPEGELK